jgi:ferric-dicitrate binding protein FerR (iron transport regulator)
MTLHDAAMTRFTQWWKRTMRTGFSYAQGKALHGSRPERLWVRESRSAWLWGLGLPLLLIPAVWVTPWAMLGFLVYPLQVRSGGPSEVPGAAARRQQWTAD